MNRPNVLPTTIPPARSRVERPPLRRGSLLIMLALVCFCLLPAGRAITPAPDGGYPNGNTAEGGNALLHLTTGTDNTAIGNNPLQNNTTDIHNTANHDRARFRKAS